MEIKSLDCFLQIAKSRPKRKVVVAAAEDEPVLQSITAAEKEGIVDGLLVVNSEKIKHYADELKLDISHFEIIEEKDPAKAACKAVGLVRENAAQILMKGLVSTADFLRAVLNREQGLRKDELLSHIGFFEVPAYHKVIALTDAAQNICPTLEEKISILKNAISAFHKIGVSCPKVALLGAVETVNPKMENTLHSAIVTQMNRRKQIKGCIIDGPLAFDNAVSLEATQHKGIESPVAGDADLLFAPNIEVGNVLYKCFTYFAGATVAATILGAACPIVLTSRADSDKSKLMSIALSTSISD